MHTVELLELATAAAKQLGFKIREEWLDGSGGGDCLIRGQKWLFLDLSQSHDDQLDIVLEALRRDPDRHQIPLQSAVKRLLNEAPAAAAPQPTQLNRAG